MYLSPKLIERFCEINGLVLMYENNDKYVFRDEDDYNSIYIKNKIKISEVS